MSPSKRRSRLTLYRSREYLHEKVIKEGLSYTQIGIELDCSDKTVLKWSKKLGIHEEKHPPLSITNPEIVDEWDFEKNDELGLSIEKATYGSRSYAYWKCKNSHSWKAQIKNRTKENRTECPDCKNRRVSESYNLLIENPDLAKQWDYTRNDKSPEDVMPHTEEEYFWICAKGHSFQCSVALRNRNGGGLDAGCKRCHRKQKTSYPEQAVHKSFILSLMGKIFILHHQIE